MSPEKANPESLKWNPLLSVKIRIPESAGNPESITNTLVKRLSVKYGDPRVRKSKSSDVMTVTFEGLKLTGGTVAGVESLVADALRLCYYVTVKVYLYNEPIREVPKRIVSEREDRYINLLLAGKPPPGGMIEFIYRPED